MPQNYYLLKSGKLRRKGNTLYLKTNKEVKAIPINNIYALFCFGEVDINTKLLIFLAQNKIPVHFFNFYGFYVGSFYPREYLNSGFLLVKQAEHYLTKHKRIHLAKEILRGAIFTILKNLSLYKKKSEEIVKHIEEIDRYQAQLENANKIDELLGIEGMCRNLYYKCFSFILKNDFEFDKRSKRPPKNKLNALISFGNSLIYALCVSEIYNTQLNPTISYLHEPSERRFSLALDLAEIFKPLIADRIIFKLVNNQMLKDFHFDSKLNFCYLTNHGKRIFLEEFEKKLKTTVYYRSLRRRVSYQRLIRLECYKLIKHLIGEKTYKSLKPEW